ncbi:PhoX family protein [Halalkalibacter urbisdiaboli]|uniref:PhoX family protein n=1 Tax=Halalkalibacter urbisdiaboli TaxID=1960589 RepID=UPI000B432A3E|nr:alkaline phosphatase PhoX [Halalkalibacter urbisdiaboli]
MEQLNRRKFLTYVGTGVTALTVASTGLGALTEKVSAAEKVKANSHLFGFKKKVSGLGFTPIDVSTKDELRLPKGYKYDVIAAYGDKINKKGDTFGFNNDFTMFFPIDGSNDRGLLWVNHEYSSELFVHGKKQGDTYTKSQIEKLLYNQGGSIIEVYRDSEGIWKMDTDSKYARRITGLTPFNLTGPAKGSKTVGGATTVQGTFANCSGGMTPWNTVLSAEENYEYTAADAGLNDTHYGWIVEVDPFNEKFTPRKHTALGRFHHENAAVGTTNDGRIVVYMGDDKKDACVYKFISKYKYVKSRGTDNSKLLEEGTLYVADMKNGKWLPLTIDAVREAAKGDSELLDKFQTQADVLVHTHDAAILLGGTPTDRPEDVEISPFDKTVFIAHTNNDKHGNIHGHITRFIEEKDDLGSLTFDFQIFAAGGSQNGFSAPDNLTFDSEGNLWTVTDMSGSAMNKGVFTSFGNNGIYVIPTMGENQGEAYRFATAPVDSEITGPCFTPDETTLFVAVQHPGERSKDLNNLTSMWPHRSGDTMPRPAVVAITGFKY